MKRLAALTLALAACARDLTTPPEPEPGRVTGRVVFAVPARSDLKPASNAKVALLGTSLTVSTNQAGTFTLAPLEETGGVLLFSYDSDGDGLVDRQRTERLEDWNTGVHRQVDMGDVVLGENAALHGRVLLADKPGAKSGLGGSAVFVPEGPFTAYTGDDGTFSLANLPPGPLQIVVFHAGYAPAALGTLTLRPAEDFSVKDVVLAVSTAPQTPGAIVGGLGFSPAASGKGDSAVTAQAVTGPAFSGTVADGLTFRIAMLPPGLYSVAATRTGYTRANVPNVLVLPAGEASVGVVLVTDQPEPDGGSYPAGPDAGPAVDAGTDAGPGGCTTNAQCTLTQWCDQGTCQTQCSASLACTNGRSCDLSTGTCFTPCDGGCTGGLTCVTGACRAACDGSFPCPAGQACTAMNVCGPECSTTLPCTAQHLTCSGGQCVPKPSCVNDFDCAETQMCLVGTCKTRPTMRVDGGAFGCAMACDCRLGEWCTGGLCQPDLVPTLWFAADGGGNGLTRAAAASDLGAKLAASGPKAVLALRADDRFYSEAPFTVPTGPITLAGGFVDCKDDRWVRSESSRSVLATDAGIVVSVVGTPSFPLAGVALHNLKVQTSAQNSGCDDDAISATDTLRLDVSRVEGGLEGVTDCSGVNAGYVTSLVRCSRCTDFSFADLHLKNTPSRKNVLGPVDLFQSSGAVRKLLVDPQTAVFRTFFGVVVDQQAGPVRVEDSTFPEVTAGGAGAYGLWASSCATKPIIVERNTFRFPKSLDTQNSGGGSGFSNCTAVEVRDNLYDGAPTTGPMYPANTGIDGFNVAGVFERNVIRLPVPTNNTPAIGIAVSGTTGGTVTLRDNVITGGGGVQADGVRISNPTTPVVLQGNFIDVGPARDSRAVFLSGPSFRVIDNFTRARGDGTCLGGASGIALNGALGVFERNRAFALGSVVTRGFSADGFNNAQIELYSNHLWAGAAACNGESTAYFMIATPQALLAGNTLDVEANTSTTATSRALSCAGSLIFMRNNVVGAGGSANRRMVDATASGCITPANWSKNYLWLDHASPTPLMADAWSSVVLAGQGILDANGNVFNGTASPFDAVQPPVPDAGVVPRYRPSASNAFAVDRGVVPKRADMTDVWLDLDRRPRDAGASADLGCCERY